MVVQNKTATLSDEGRGFVPALFVLITAAAFCAAVVINQFSSF